MSLWSRRRFRWVVALTVHVVLGAGILVFDLFPVIGLLHLFGATHRAWIPAAVVLSGLPLWILTFHLVWYLIRTARVAVWAANRQRSLS